MKMFKGEQVLARLTARLIPPDARYEDCICQLILTERHLYIIEDNYNGTYNTLFTLFIERIQNIEAQVKGKPWKRPALNEMIVNGCLLLFGGIIYASGQKNDDNGIRLVITYDDGMGQSKTIYFKDLQSNSNHFIKTYHKRKESLHQWSTRILHIETAAHVPASGSPSECASRLLLETAGT